MNKHVNLKISGKVQRVWFWVHAKRKADRLDITGFARSEPDGAVYIEAEGAEQQLQEFIEWCQHGSELAEVSKVETEEGGLQNYNDFMMRIGRWYY